MMKGVIAMINMTKRRGAKITKRSKRRGAAALRRAKVHRVKQQVLTPDLITSVAPKSSTQIKYLTDLNVASFLVKLNGKDIRYLHPAEKWLVWDGKRWAEDKT